MGYQTDFQGQFNLDQTLIDEHKQYLHKFAQTRRMQRDEDKVELMEDPIRESVDLPVGHDGAYFVGGGGFAGQYEDKSIINFNHPPGGEQFKLVRRNGTAYMEAAERPEWAQPGLWCQWEPNEDGSAIEWNGAEKFYDYIEWIEYLIQNFLGPWGYKVNGEVRWRGEEPNDSGIIYIKDNVVESVNDETVGLSWN